MCDSAKFQHKLYSRYCVIVHFRRRDIFVAALCRPIICFIYYVITFTFYRGIVYNTSTTDKFSKNSIVQINHQQNL